MKALRWHARGDVRVDDVPMPHPGDHDVLLKVEYSGICGSEVHEYVAGPIFIPLEPHPLTGRCAPQILGHEFGGRVVSVGSAVLDLQAGDLITVDPIVACGVCNTCRRGRSNLCEKLAYYGAIGDGGHAEYAVVHAANAVKLPANIPTELVAFAEPAGVAFHAVNQAGVQPGSTVVVLGGGPIGQLVVQYARLAGAARVFLTEIAPARIACARSIGVVDEVFNPVETDVVAAVLDLTRGEGADHVIECSGGSRTGMLADTAAQAIELTRPEGVTAIVGTFAGVTEIHFNTVVIMERRIVGSWVWHSHSEYQRAMEMVILGKIQVRPLISRTVTIDRAVPDGIQELQFNKDSQMKILVDLR